MANKKPEDKKCHISYFDNVVDDILGGIYGGYDTENTLNEMIKRNSNGGLLDVEKVKIKLLKAVLPKLNSVIEEYQKDLADIVLELEQNVISDANSIRKGTSNFHFDYQSESKRIENVKYEMSRFERSVDDSMNIIEELEKEMIN
jgi:hypothetical protein